MCPHLHLHVIVPAGLGSLGRFCQLAGGRTGKGKCRKAERKGGKAAVSFGRIPEHFLSFASGPAAGLALSAICSGVTLGHARLHFDDGHHAEVLVAENVAVEDEVTDIGTAEVHEELN